MLLDKLSPQAREALMAEVWAEARKRASSGAVEDTRPLSDQQRAFMNDAHTFSGFIGGVGSGKTWAGARKALKKALSSVNTGMVTAPTYNSLRDATLPTFRMVADSYIEKITNSPPINVTLSNGSTIFFRSADSPELLRGPSLSWWWGDEAALYHRDVWRIMIGRLRQGGQLGSAWLTTTPKGRNWIYQEFIQKERDEYAIYKAKTRENPFIDEAYFNTLAESYQGDFARQELDGEFVAFEGLIYSEFDRDTHASLTGWKDRPTTFKQIIAGVDWGFANPGVIQIVGLDGDLRAYLLHEEHARRRQIDDWADVAKQLRDQWHIETFYCDPSEPDYIKKFNAKPGVKAIAADNSVLPGIQTMQGRLIRQGDGKPRLFINPAAVHTLAEFESYQWAENKYGVRDEPLKTNDHCMDALRYPLHSIEKRQPITATIRKYA